MTLPSFDLSAVVFYGRFLQWAMPESTLVNMDLQHARYSCRSSDLQLLKLWMGMWVVLKLFEYISWRIPSSMNLDTFGIRKRKSAGIVSFDTTPALYLILSICFASNLIAKFYAKHCFDVNFIFLSNLFILNVIHQWIEMIVRIMEETERSYNYLSFS